MKRFHVIEIQIKENSSPIKRKLFSTDWFHKALVYSTEKIASHNLQEDLFTKRTHHAEIGWSDRFNNKNGLPTYILIIKKTKKKDDKLTCALLISKEKLNKFKTSEEDLT